MTNDSAANTSDDTAPAAESPPAAPPLQPAGSKIVFLQQDNELTFAVPHTGFRGAALVFVILALAFGGFGGLLFSIFLAVAVKHPSFDNLIPLLGLSVFVALGALLLLAALQFAFRKAVLVASPQELVYTQKGPLHNAEFIWKRETISAIRADASGTVINDRPLQELQIWSTDGGKRGFFDGRPNDEIEWLAFTLRQFYGVPPRPADNN